MCVAVAALGLTAMQTAVVGTLAAGTALSAYGTYQQGQAAKQVANNNRIMAEYAAQDAVNRGEEDAIKVRRRADQLKGTQRATMASRGLDLNAGTPAEILDQTDFFAQQDITTTRNNAQRSAWAARASGNAQAAQGAAAASQANLGAFSTLLGGGAQVAGKWMQYTGKG